MCIACRNHVKNMMYSKGLISLALHLDTLVIMKSFHYLNIEFNENVYSIYSKLVVCC